MDLEGENPQRVAVENVETQKNWITLLKNREGQLLMTLTKNSERVSCWNLAMEGAFFKLRMLKRPKPREVKASLFFQTSTGLSLN